MPSTIKPVRKVVGSISGEVFETTSPPDKVPRRRLPDGRTETGKPLLNDPEEAAGAPEPKPATADPEIVSGNVEITVDETEDDGVTVFDEREIQIPPGEVPEEEPLRGRQAPKSTKKDVNKLEDLFFAFGCALDDQKYTGEQKAVIIANLFADTTDVRVETSQYVMSARMYGVLAASAATLLLMKDSLSGGLLANYRRVMASMDPRQTKIPDPFGEE